VPGVARSYVPLPGEGETAVELSMAAQLAAGLLEQPGPSGASLTAPIGTAPSPMPPAEPASNGKQPSDEPNHPPVSAGKRKKRQIPESSSDGE